MRYCRVRRTGFLSGENSSRMNWKEEHCKIDYPFFYEDDIIEKQELEKPFRYKGYVWDDER